MISVVVTVYNIEEYLETCIKSILRQSFSDLDIILVDDGSNDMSGNICDKYVKLDTRIKVIHQTNKGPHEARKAGLKKAIGEYVIFVDGDDVIEQDLCRKMLSLIQENKVDFVHCNYLTNGEKDSPGIVETKIINLQKLSENEKKRIIAQNVLVRHNNTNFIAPSIWSKIFKKSFIDECFEKVVTNLRYGEDLICLCHMIMLAKSMMLCTDAFYNYIERVGSLSHNFDLYNLARTSKLFYELNDTFNIYGEKTLELKESLDQYYFSNVMYSLSKMENGNFHINQFYFAQIQLLRNKRIIIYGAGKVGKDYYDQLARYKDIDIVAWVDKNADTIELDYFEISNPCIIRKLEADIILIAVNEYNLYSIIKNELQEYTDDVRKIVWNRPQKTICMRSEE